MPLAVPPPDYTMRLAASCGLGIVSVLKKEIKDLGGFIDTVGDHMVTFRTTEEMAAMMCLRLSTASRLYQVVADAPCESWDELFEIVQGVPWKELALSKCPIRLRSVHERHILTSEPTAQSIVKKAITSSLKKDGSHWDEDLGVPALDILLIFSEKNVKVLLDIVGDPLHKRWYRREMVEAPLKETLAAAMLRLANYTGTMPLMDATCGSGTLVIEAARRARNMASGRDRNFRLEHLPHYPGAYFVRARQAERESVLLRAPEKIRASDISEDAVQIAQENARRAGVDSDIAWEVSDIRSALTSFTHGTIVSNPPYGVRLGAEDAEYVHRSISEHLAAFSELHACVITPDERFLAARRYDEGSKHLKVSNGDRTCYIWYR